MTEEQREYQRKWRANNKDKVIQYANSKQRKEYEKKYREEHQDTMKIYQEEYRTNNSDRKKELNRNYQMSNREKINKNLIEKRKSDICFRIAGNLRSRLRKALLDNHKTGSAVRDLGCSIEDFKHHIESQFSNGMAWHNYGDWHLDHIKPLASFDLSDRTQLLEACHYSNIQPLWAKDNFVKGKKYVR